MIRRAQNSIWNWSVFPSSLSITTALYKIWKKYKIILTSQSNKIASLNLPRLSRFSHLVPFALYNFFKCCLLGRLHQFELRHRDISVLCLWLSRAAAFYQLLGYSLFRSPEPIKWSASQRWSALIVVVDMTEVDELDEIHGYSFCSWYCRYILILCRPSASNTSPAITAAASHEPMQVLTEQDSFDDEGLGTCVALYAFEGKTILEFRCSAWRICWLRFWDEGRLIIAEYGFRNHVTEVIVLANWKP